MTWRGWFQLCLALCGAAALGVGTPGHTQERPITDADRQILVMLKMAPPHYRPGSSYGGSYGDTTAMAARRRMAAGIARRNGLKLVDGWPMPLIGVGQLVEWDRCGTRRELLVHPVEQRKPNRGSVDQYGLVSARLDLVHDPAAGPDPGPVMADRAEQDGNGQAVHDAQRILNKLSSEIRPPPSAMIGSIRPTQLRCVGQASG
jgi:hypothetical protein